jgi:hypothetical protein
MRKKITIKSAVLVLMMTNCMLSLALFPVMTRAEEDGDDNYKRYWVYDHTEELGIGAINEEYYTSYEFMGKLNVSGSSGRFDYNLQLFDDDKEKQDEFDNHVTWSQPPGRIEVGKESEVGINVSFTASNWELDSSHVGFMIRLESTEPASELETADVISNWRYESYDPDDSYWTTTESGARKAPDKVDIQKTIYPNTSSSGGIPDLSEATWDVSDQLLIISAYDVMTDFKKGVVVNTEYVYRMVDKPAAVEEVPVEQFTHEDFTDASTNPGEDEGTEISQDVFSDIDNIDVPDIPDVSPEAVIVGAGGAIAAAGGIGAASKKKSKKKSKTKDKKNKDKDKEEPKKPSTFKMYVNKDFGDTLIKGEEPKYVYARIVEITPEKWEKERLDLTKKIEVFSRDNSLIVTDVGVTSNGYKAAMVEVPEESNQSQGLVSFKFVGPSGTYVRNVIFNLIEPAINFLQENIGLPAHYEKESTLPFGVVGMPDDTVVTISCDAKKKDKPVYNVTLTQDEKQKRIYYLHIRDILPDDEEDAGTSERYTVEIKAQSKEKTIETYYPIIRIHMGLALFLEGDAIGCFLRFKEGREHMGATRAVGSELAWNISVTGCMGLDPAAALIIPGAAAVQSTTMATANPMKSGSLVSDDIEPCVTKGKIFLLRWNEEEKYIERIAVYPDKDCLVTPDKVLNSKNVHTGDAGMAHMELVDRLAIKVFATNDVDEHGARTIKVCSTGCALDPPTRMSAYIMVSATYDDKLYTVTRKVLLHSMPFRHSQTEAEAVAYEKWDAHVTETLINIECKIYDNYMYHLSSLHNMIKRMTEGYDKRFGYDNDQLNVVMNTWVGFLKGEKKGARGRAYTVSLADDLEAAYAFLEGMRDNGGLLGRIGLGICTAGYSEHLFFAMELGKKMKEAVFKCQGDDEFGFLDGVWMGAKDYAISELQGLVMAKGLQFAGGMVNIAASAYKGKDVNVFESIAKGYRNTMDAIDQGLKSKSKLYKGGSDMLDGVKNFFNSSAKATKEAMNRDAQIQEAANKKAQTTIAQRRQGKGTELKSADDWASDELFDLAKENGMEKVRKLWEAQQKMTKAKGTSGGYWKAKEEYEALCKEVWRDKNALKQLKNYDGAAGIDMRYEFNRYREKVKARVSEQLLDDIASQTGKKRSDLYISSASSNSNADVWAGKTLPEDWDVTVTEINYSERAKAGTYLIDDPKFGGKPVAKEDIFLVIDQDLAGDSLARNLYKEVYGVEPPSIKAARDAAKKLDVTYVQPVWTKGQTIEPNPEAYADLAGMIDKSMHGRDLKALELNRKSFAYKGNEWYHTGDALNLEAAKLEAKAKDAFGQAKESFLKEAREARFEAIACYVEGTRQITKQTNKISIPRNICKMANGAQDAFSKNAREIHALAQRVGLDLSPGQFFNILQNDYGIDKYAYTQLMSECLV